MKILVIDVGGTHLKVQVPGAQEAHAFDSGPSLTPKKMMRLVQAIAPPESFDVVSIGYPGLVTHGRIATEPQNLGRGWVGFDFEKALGHPVKIVNDAAMQALGSYQGKRMLFLGLGTGLGSTMIVEGKLEAMELAHLPYKKGLTYEDYVGARGLKRLGNKKWRKHVLDVVERLRSALEPDYVVLGGGNARKLGELPEGVRLGTNANAFAGGLRLWTPNVKAPRSAASAA